jgi:hypothetical protein
LLGLAQGDQLALTWMNTAGGGTPTGNDVEVSGAMNTTVPVGLTEQFTFTGVPSGTYTFRVRASNGAGRSAASNAVTLAFPGGCAVPAAPEGLQTYVDGSVVTIRWNSPTTGAAATKYVLTVSGPVSLVLPVSGRSLSSPAPPGTYTFTVAAQNACGTGPQSPAQSVTVRP